jgi:hypothetical protein
VTARTVAEAATAVPIRPKERLVTSSRNEARQHVKASPARIFDLLCQPETHIAIDVSGILSSADGKTVRAIGDEFVLHMDQDAPTSARGLGNYDITIVITQYAPDVALGWTMRAFGREATGYAWGYLLEEDSGGTMVTSYYDWHRAEEVNEGTAFVPIMPEYALAAMLSLLTRLAEA